MRRSWITTGAALAGAAVLGASVAIAVVKGGGDRMRPPSTTTSMADGDAGVAPASKQLWTCGMHPQVIQDHPGNCPICHMKLTPLKADDEGGGGAGTKEKKIAYWWDPMLGPSSIADHPGKSAMGMDLVPVYEQQVQAGPGVRIDPAVVQNMGVLTAPVTRGPLRVTIRAVGVLEVPQPGMHDVTLKINGYVQKLYADTEGMSVSKGQVLFDLYSPELQVAEQELIAAEQNFKSLGADAAPGLRSEAGLMVESSRRKLLLWDFAPQDVDAVAAADRAPRTLPYRSPADGHVADKAVVEGSAVQQGQKLMRVEDHRTLWLDAQVYEDQIQAVKIGQEVRASIDGLPGRTFAGRVTFVYPHVDHMTRTEIVRTTLDNPDHEFRPGMYATAEIVTTPVADAVLVPRESVIDTGARQLAFVVDPASPGHFLPRRVRVGMSGDDDKVQIVEGLAPGDSVVTSGQFLMDVESRTTEAIQKLRGTNEPMSAEASEPTTTATPPMQDAMPGTAPSSMPSGMTMRPSAEPATKAAQLSVAHCPMKKADWLQVGDAVANPYFGTSMATCGSITRRLPAPPADSPLSSVVAAYLKVVGGLDADKLDPAAASALRQAAEALTDPAYGSAKASVTKLATAAGVDDARADLAPASAALISLLNDAPK